MHAAIPVQAGWSGLAYLDGNVKSPHDSSFSLFCKFHCFLIFYAALCSLLKYSSQSLPCGASFECLLEDGETDRCKGQSTREVLIECIKQRKLSLEPGWPISRAGHPACSTVPVPRTRAHRSKRRETDLVAIGPFLSSFLFPKADRLRSRKLIDVRGFCDDQWSMIAAP